MNEKPTLPFSGGEDGVDITQMVDDVEKTGVDFFDGLLSRAEGVDYDDVDIIFGLGDRVTSTGFFRALDYLLSQKYPNLKDSNTQQSNNRILMRPNALPLFERNNRTASPLIHGAEEMPRDTHRVALEWDSAVGIMGRQRAMFLGNPGKFLMFQRYKTPNHGYSHGVEYSGAMTTATYNKYGERRYIIAAALALGIPENEWAALPTIVPEVLPPDEDELKLAKEKYHLDDTALNIGVVVNSAMDNKMITLSEWREHLLKLEAVLRSSGHDFANSPVHVNFFYNPGTRSNYDFSEQDMREQFGDKIGNSIFVNYIGASLAELPATLQLQDAVMSVDTALAHIATALKDGPEVAMLFDQVLTPSDHWQSSAKQHPVNIKLHANGQLEQLTIEALQHKGKL